MKHAMVLGSMGVVLGLIGVVATWNLRLGPRWYPILLVALALPQSWLGGKLAELRSRKVEAVSGRAAGGHESRSAPEAAEQRDWS